MSLKSKLSSTITLAFAVVAFGTFASAQDTAKPQDDGQKLERKGERHRGMRGGKFGRHGMRGGMFGLRGIELTDAQKEQVRQIREANKPSEELRNELRTIREARKAGGELTDAQKERIKAIREQMRVIHENVRAQVLAVLTPEQRTQLEARKAEMQKRREGMRERRKEMRQKRQEMKSTDNN